MIINQQAFEKFISGGYDWDSEERKEMTQFFGMDDYAIRQGIANYCGHELPYTLSFLGQQIKILDHFFEGDHKHIEEKAVIFEYNKCAYKLTFRADSWSDDDCVTDIEVYRVKPKEVTTVEYEVVERL